VAPPELVLAATEPTPQTLPAGLRRYLLATRPAFLTITLVGVLLGMSTAWFGGASFKPLAALLTLIFALTAHAGANVINDYYDQAGDAANTERVFPFTGGSRFIQNGVLSAREVMLLGYGLLAAVIPAGLWLSAQTGGGLIAIGVAGLLTGWAYSAPPLKLASRGLGEFAITAGWILVVVGSDFVQRGTFAPLPLLTGFGFALLVAAVLYINQFPDTAADAASGKRTMVVRLGRRAARLGYLILVLLAHASVAAGIAGGVLPTSTIAVIAALPFSLVAMRELWRHAETPEKLAPAIKLTIAAAHLFGILLTAALLYSKGNP
jgi:1,4-dihydroxy-2-naphthoate octaprenyltransferase